MRRNRAPKMPPAGTIQRRGILLSVLAALLWPLQAGVIAFALGGLLTAPADAPILQATLVLILLSLCRVGISAWSQSDLAKTADQRILALRTEVIRTEAGAAQASILGGAGALAALASDQLEALRPWLLRYQPARYRAAVLPLVIFGLSLWFSWAVAVVLLFAGPLIPLFMALVGWAAKAASERQMTEIGQMNDLLVDRLAALSDLRLIGAGQAVIDSFAAASNRLHHRTMAVLKIAFLSSTVLELFAALGVAMVAIWVGFTLLGELHWGSWGRPLSPEAGIFLLLLAPDFFQPLRDLAAAWHDRAAAEAVLDRVEAWRAQDRPMHLGDGKPTGRFGPARVDWQDLRLRGIRYPDITLTPGDCLAIIGPSGSGKTTLLRLLAGLDRPDGGIIRLNGQPLDDSTANAWRCEIGWMPQAPHFMNRSLRFNIGFGGPLPPDLIERARLQGVLATLPRGLHTVLGERGEGLSGGEARRVTLARALQGGRSILLADEPTADLDAATAKAVTEALLAFAKAGGSLVVATHDKTLATALGRQLRLGGSSEGRA